MDSQLKMIDHLHAKPVRLRSAHLTELDLLSDIDTDASALFDQAGLHLELADDHEFAVAERNRLLRCLHADTVLLAIDAHEQAVGFIALDVLDHEPYVAQLSVRLTSMRQGIGAQLLDAADDIARAGSAQSLWLTTYRHLIWNGPFYERHGFVAMARRDCGEELRRVSDFERQWLPMPEHRIVMRKQLRSVA